MVALAVVSCLASAAFLPATPSILAPQLSSASVQPSRTTPAQLALRNEPVEFFKAGLIASLAGGLATLPVKESALLTSGMLPEFQFSTISLAVQLSAFAIVYRCSVRMDDNDTLKFLIIAASSLLRAFSSTSVRGASLGTSSYGILTADTTLTIVTYLGESALAFGAAATAIEYASNRGWIYRFPEFVEPSYRGYYDDYRGGPGSGPGAPRRGGFRGLPPRNYRGGPEYYDEQGFDRFDSMSTPFDSWNTDAPRNMRGSRRVNMRDARDQRETRNGYMMGPGGSYIR